MFDIRSVKLKNEDEIMSSWSIKDNIVVSIVCPTYNHQLFIEDAITGFLMQETNFAFEVIIHDDASTDDTTNIIRKYQAKYPRIIKPIYQTENQYSKGVKTGLHAAGFAKGRFLAWCEGDDYWCSKKKLMKQFHILNKNPDIKMCAHPYFKMSKKGTLSACAVYSNSNVLLPPENFIIGDGDYVATCSLFFRESFVSNLPDWFFNKAPVGDYYLQILSSYPKGAWYLNEPMCVYRRYSDNNWSSRTLTDCHSIISFRSRMIETNLMCEKELNNFSLFEAFTLANFKQFKSCMGAKYKVSSIKSFINYFMKLFQFRFFFYPIFQLHRKLSEILRK